MARALKVISINFPFKNKSVDQVDTFATDHALFDFDVVVVRPYSILTNQRAYDDGINFKLVEHEITHKIGDLSRLFANGGLLVVILDAKSILNYHSGHHSVIGGSHHVTSNYDFLNPQFSSYVQNGKGSSIHYLHSDHPFVDVLRKSTVQWTAYVVSPHPQGLPNLKIFATNGKDSWVGASSGRLIFLPNITALAEEAFFDACRAIRGMADGTPRPTWVKDVFLPDEAAQLSKVEKLAENVAELQSAELAAIKDLTELQSLKKLLYEKGKYQLEPVVRSALDRLGFKTTEGGDIPGTIYEIDGRTTVGSKPGILEIKGLKNQTSLKEFSGLPIKVLKDFELTGSSSKGILVANGFCEDPPGTRTGDKIFSPHVIEAAKGNSVALINAVELYAVVCGVMLGEITDLEQIREKIISTSGYVDLFSFCKTNPLAPASVVVPANGKYQKTPIDGKG